MRDGASRVGPGTDRQNRIVDDCDGHERRSLAVPVGSRSVSDRFNGDIDPGIRNQPCSRAEPDKRADHIAYERAIPSRSDSCGAWSDARPAGATGADGPDGDGPGVDHPYIDDRLKPADADPDSDFRGADLLATRNGNL